MKTSLATAVALLLAAAPAAAQMSLVDAPEVRGPIASDAVGSGSRDYPFNAAVDDLAAHGYVEEEFFFSGSTPVGTYTSRMLVRRPADPARFSGTVLAEWTNVTNRYDVDALWMRSSEHVMREGDAYVAIDVQALGVDAPRTGLRAWSPRRYGALHMPALATTGGSIVERATDAGMFDIFGQALRAIRTSTRVLGGARPRMVLATGTSQSALYLYLYAQTYDLVQRLTDGFLITGASTSTLGLNGLGSVNLPVVATRVPVLWLNTETDNSFTRFADSGRFRLWEVAGTTHLDHDAREVQRVYVRRDFGTDMRALTDCAHRPFSRIPFRYAQNAGVEALQDWVRTGAAPRSQPSYEYDSDGRIARDGNLNALGGVRLPQFAVPTSTESRENTGACKALYGRSVPFDQDRLRVLYPTHDDYVAKVRAAAAAAVESGVLVPADAAATVSTAQTAPVPDPPPVPARACANRRVVVLRFPRRVRGRAVTGVRVKVAGRRTMVVRSRTLRVPLVGLPAGTVRVRVTLTLRGGRTVTMVRRFPVCVS